MPRKRSLELRLSLPLIALIAGAIAIVALAVFEKDAVTNEFLHGPGLGAVLLQHRREGSRYVAARKMMATSIADSGQQLSRGADAVAEAVVAMRQTAEKTTIIEEIARSTKMLSLNASIEAARAGEHGKGFTPVVSEAGNVMKESVCDNT